jgi:hypothetical protein
VATPKCWGNIILATANALSYTQNITPTDKSKKQPATEEEIYFQQCQSWVKVLSFKQNVFIPAKGNFQVQGELM